MNLKVFVSNAYAAPERKAAAVPIAIEHERN
jgi:hypothetical protein